MKLLKLTLMFVIMAISVTSCIGDGDETIILEDAVNNTDIPGDNLAKANPVVSEINTSIPNIQYSSVDEDGTAVIRIDMTGIQDRNTKEYLRLYGTNDPKQNLWLEVDGTPKGVKVYNTIDDANGRTLPVDLVFLVDNSGSMDDEANTIARDIAAWASSLASTGLDIRFGCIGYDGRITGGIDLTTSNEITSFLNRPGKNGTARTVGFVGSLKGVSTAKYDGESADESGMAALRFADENLSFRSNANRIYVNFTDEENIPPRGEKRYSVESLKTDWDTNRGTIHTVFSDGEERRQEYNYLMSEYTGGTVINTNSSFTGVTLESLPVTGAMKNSYIIRFTNVKQYMDGKPHTIKLTVKTPDGNVQAERSFDVIFKSIDYSDNTPSDNNTSKEGRVLTGTWCGIDSGEPFIYVFYKDGSGFAGYGSDPNYLEGRKDIIQDYTVKNGHLLILWDGDDEWDDKGPVRNITASSFELNLYNDGWIVFKKQ